MANLTDLMEAGLANRVFDDYAAVQQGFVDFINANLADFPPGCTYRQLIGWFYENGWLQQNIVGGYETVPSIVNEKKSQGLKLPPLTIPETDEVLCKLLRSHIINATTINQMGLGKTDPGYYPAKIFQLSAEVYRRGGKLSLDENYVLNGSEARRYQIALNGLYFEWQILK
jgi:hypothetical protein